MRSRRHESGCDDEDKQDGSHESLQDEVRGLHTRDTVARADGSRRPGRLGDMLRGRRSQDEGRKHLMAANPRGAMTVPRAATAAAIVLIVLQLLAVHRLPARLWGLSAPAFAPPWMEPVLLVLAALLLLPRIAVLV